jgi:hypothetical protein
MAGGHRVAEINVILSDSGSISEMGKCNLSQSHSTDHETTTTVPQTITMAHGVWPSMGPATFDREYSTPVEHGRVVGT